MSLDSWIERLAFGRTRIKLRACLGLYLSGDTAFLAEVRTRGGRPAVEHLLRLPMPESPAGRDTPTKPAAALDADALTQTDRLASALKGALEQARLGSEHVVVTVSHHFGLLRYFTLPGIDRRFWRTAVPAEAKKYIPLPFADLAHDFQMIPLEPGPDQRPRYGVLFGVLHRRNLAGIQALVQRLGLNLAGVEIAPCSTERLWDHLGGQSRPPAWARIFFEGPRARILISDQGIPIFFRDVRLDVDGGAVDRRKLDLSGCVDFVRKQLAAQPPRRILIGGVSQQLAAWREALSQEIGKPLELEDTARALGLRSGEWGAYAAIGAGLRHLVPTPVRLDLSQSQQVTQEEKNAASVMFVLAALAAAFLAVAGGLNYGRVLLDSRELAKARRNQAALPAFQGKLAEQIRTMVQEAEARTDALLTVTTPGTRLTHILEDIAKDVPEALWLTELRYSSLIEEGAAASRALVLTGRVIGPNASAEQDVAILFREKLQGDPRFGAAFSCGGVSVQAGSGATQNPDVPSDPERLSELQESRTAFTIQCSAKRT